MAKPYAIRADEDDGAGGSSSHQRRNGHPGEFVDILLDFLGGSPIALCCDSFERAGESDHACQFSAGPDPFGSGLENQEVWP